MNTVSEDDTPKNVQGYCIIFGQSLQGNETPLAVIFVPVFQYNTKGR